MLIDKNFFKTKENQTLIKETISKSDFLSFDMEMTGISLGIESNLTEYDLPQTRYTKMKKVVEEYETIQVGFTFYLPETRNVKSSLNEDETITEKFYIERTFSAYLFKSSPFKFLIDLYKNQVEYESIFQKNIKSNPETLKFLIENSFDYSKWILQSHHYNKLNKRNQIINLLEQHIREGRSPDSLLVFSTKAKESIMKIIYEIMDFIFDKSRKRHEIDIKEAFYIAFILTLNIPKYLSVKNVNLSKIKAKPSILLIEKSKSSLDLSDFSKKFNFQLENNEQINDTHEKIKKLITFEDLYDFKYKTILLKTNDNQGIEEFVNEELGFSLLISEVINSKKPIIGHNMLYDLMFLYDKFIDDLPSDITSFYTNIHNTFPMIIDTKIIADFAGKFSNTKLAELMSSIEKQKFDKYIKIIPDVMNNFFQYDTPNETIGKIHDAGYDSRITGRCFISLVKGLEYNFISNIENNELSKREFIQFDLLKTNQIVNRLVYNVGKSFPFNYLYIDSHIDLWKMQVELIYKTYYNVIILETVKDNMTIFSIKDIIESSTFVYKIVKFNKKIVIVEIVNINIENIHLVDEAIKEISSNSSISKIVKYNEYFK